MRGRGLWILVALGVSTSVSAFVGCGGDEFSFDCEGDECPQADAGDDINGPDGGSDGAIDAPSDAPDADVVPGCNGASSPAEDPCVIDEEFGIFVSPQGDDDSGEGTRTAPFASLAKGLAEAHAAGKKLYACDDDTGYAERITIDASLDGLAAHGGFECGTWAYGNTKAKVKPSAPGVVWRFDGLTTGFLLEDFDIEALDAAGKGESSIAVIANESAGVVLRGVNVTAGKGADGESPTAPGAAANGTDGNPGKAQCSDEPVGGAAAEAACEGVATTGGKGGNGAVGNTSAGNGDQGLPEAPGGGAPGIGQTSASACTDGGNGKDGEAGAAGAGASGLGALNASGWAGAAGALGKAGTPGQGGGGGGGGRRATGCDSVIIFPVGTAIGASGGSGGAGGCGGKGGEGGGAGGASIALVSIDSELALHDCNLTSADGGDGGIGADGQGGGSGGNGGARGGQGACRGGDGGFGGNGGPGGGGAGGHSLGIAYKGTEPTRTGGDMTIGDAGKGGAGASGDAAGEGEDGKSAEVLAF